MSALGLGGLGGLQAVQAGTIGFTFINSLPVTVISIRLAPAGSTFWTPNLIEARPLVTGGEMALGLETIGSGCHFDLMAQFQEIDELFFDGQLDLCQTARYMLTPELFGGRSNDSPAGQ